MSAPKLSLTVNLPVRGRTWEEVKDQVNALDEAIEEHNRELVFPDSHANLRLTTRPVGDSEPEAEK